MSTHDNRPNVYLEFPNFGYGPASALLTLVAPIVEDYTWHIVSTGGAAEFVRNHLPNATVHDIDTFSAESWAAVCAVAPPGSVFVSATNPHFAGWAAQRGYRICIVDTLDWMWDASPPGVEDAELHLVQRYFGSREDIAGDTGKRRYIRPIVDPHLWNLTTSSPRPGTAVVAFGGMTVPGRGQAIGQYTSWILSAALPQLVGHAGCSEVHVVGARPDLREWVPAQWASHPAVTITTGLDRVSYAHLMRTSEHHVIAPGLATLHECAAAGIAPLIQPGFSMSMVLQANDLVSTGYPYTATWPWLEKVVAELAGMPELDGLRHLSGLIDDAVRNSDPDTAGVSKALLSYIERDQTSALALRSSVELPDGRELIADYLSSCKR